MPWSRAVVISYIVRCIKNCRLPDGLCFFFFFNDTATTEIYTLSLHDALPISDVRGDYPPDRRPRRRAGARERTGPPCRGDRKSTRLNSSHSQISYAVFCLKKKNQSVARPAAGHLAVAHGHLRHRLDLRAADYP